MSGPAPAQGAHNAPQGPVLLAVSLTTVLLAIAASVLRYMSIRRLNRGIFIWEDRILGLALALGIITTIFTGVESVNAHKRRAALQVDYLVQPWLILSTAAAKVSICFMLLRVAAGHKPWRVMLLIQVAVIAVFSLMACFVNVLQCRPMQKLWRPEVQGVCLSAHTQHDLEHVQGAFDILTTMCISFAAILAPQIQDVRQYRPWSFYTLALVSTVIWALAIVRTYMVSLFNPEEQQYTARITGTIFAVLEQNLGIASASIIPIFAYLSKDARLARDEEAANLDASSMFSKMTFASKLSKLSRRNSTGSTILIQGPNRESYDPKAAVQLRAQAQNGGGEFLPLGIIKTVSVAVVCEDTTNAEYGIEATRPDSRRGNDPYGLGPSRPGSSRGNDPYGSDAVRPGSRRGNDLLSPDASRPSSRRAMDQ